MNLSRHFCALVCPYFFQRVGSPLLLCHAEFRQLEITNFSSDEIEIVRYRCVYTDFVWFEMSDSIHSGPWRIWVGVPKIGPWGLVSRVRGVVLTKYLHP